MNRFIGIILLSASTAVMAASCSSDLSTEDLERLRSNFENIERPATTSVALGDSVKQESSESEVEDQWGAAEAAWLARGELALHRSGPVLLRGEPIAVSSTPTQTTVWQWVDQQWSSRQVINHAGDPIQDVLEVVLDDFTGNGEPEIAVHYSVRPSEGLEMFALDGDAFVPFGPETIYRDFLREISISWSIQPPRVEHTFQACVDDCVELVAVYEWSTGEIRQVDLRCPNYYDIDPMNYYFVMICAKGQLVQQLQQALNNAGFDAGVADGFFGPATHDAVLRYQWRMGDPVTGSLHWTEVSDIISYWY